MAATISSVALKQYATNVAVPQIELVEFSDFIFLLAELWNLDTDSIKQHWVANLFAAGMGDQGREVRNYKGAFVLSFLLIKN